MMELPQSAYAGWLNYAQREPFGAPAWDLRIGYVLSVIVTAITGKKTRPADFVPQWGEKAPQDWTDMRATFRAWGQAVANHRKDQS